MPKKNVHDGHRERVRKEFLANGFNDSTPPHKVVETMLYYSIPRKDTNDLAHELLERFGTITNIIDAPEEELLKVDGIGPNTVALIRLIIHIMRIYKTEKAENKKFSCSDQICEFLLAKYLGFKKETFALTSLTSEGRFIAFDQLCQGDATSVLVSVREVIEIAIKRNAACVVISHNHPDGNALPSRDDIEITKTIKSVLDNVNVKLLDHVIIADNDYVSLLQSRGFSDIFKK